MSSSSSSSLMDDADRSEAEYEFEDIDGGGDDDEEDEDEGDIVIGDDDDDEDDDEDDHEHDPDPTMFLGDSDSARLFDLNTTLQGYVAQMRGAISSDYVDGVLDVALGRGRRGSRRIALPSEVVHGMRIAAAGGRAAAPPQPRTDFNSQVPVGGRVHRLLRGGRDRSEGRSGRRRGATADRRARSTASGSALGGLLGAFGADAPAAPMETETGSTGEERFESVDDSGAGSGLFPFAPDDAEASPLDGRYDFLESPIGFPGGGGGRRRFAHGRGGGSWTQRRGGSRNQEGGFTVLTGGLRGGAGAADPQSDSIYDPRDPRSQMDIRRGRGGRAGGQRRGRQAVISVPRELVVLSSSRSGAVAEVGAGEADGVVREADSAAAPADDGSIAVPVDDEVAPAAAPAEATPLLSPAGGPPPSTVSGGRSTTALSTRFAEQVFISLHKVSEHRDEVDAVRKRFDDARKAKADAEKAASEAAAKEKADTKAAIEAKKQAEADAIVEAEAVLERAEEAEREAAEREAAEREVAAVAEVTPPPPPPSSGGTLTIADVAAAVAGAVASAAEGGGAGREAAASSSDVPRIVEERAASAGISLIAPANEDPDVVAAAVARTGIDPTFLSALPEDMRAEVLNPYFEQVSTARDRDAADLPETTMLHQEFLIALPPALRADVLVQEASYRAARTEEAAAAPAASSAGEDNEAEASAANAGADVSNFLAELPAHLREEIFLTSDESVVANLTPDMAAEAQALRERIGSRASLYGAMHGLNPGHAHGGLLDEELAANDYEGVMAQQDTPLRRHLARRSYLTGDGRLPGTRPAVLEFSWQYDEASKTWIRRQPDCELEPCRIFGEKSMRALVQLLGLQSSHYGKSLLHQVLALLCKRSDSRRELLSILFSFLSIDGRSSSSSTDPSVSSPFSSASSKPFSCAILVRRTLEVLSNMCKHEKLTGEDIVAVPSPHLSFPALTLGEGGEAISPVVALVGLLDRPIFKRSSQHQEQLLSVLSHAFSALPSGVLSSPEEKSPSTAVGNISPEVRGEESAMNQDQDAALATATVDNAEKSEECVEAKPVLPEVPVEFRVPKLRDGDITALTNVILQDGASEKTYDRVLKVLGQFGLLAVNKDRSLKALSRSAAELGKSVAVSFERLMKQSGVSGHPNAFLDFSMASSTSELTFLRVTKAMAILLEGSASVKNVNRTGLKESDQDIDWFESLEEVWLALDRILVAFRSTISKDGSSSRPKKRSRSELRPSAEDSAAMVDDSIPDGRPSPESDSPEEASPGEDEDSEGEPGVSSPTEKYLSPTLARLSPVIESFFVCHGVGLSDGDDRESVDSPGTPSQPSSSGEGVNLLTSTGSGAAEGVTNLESFIKRHRVAINSIIRVNPSLLDGPFRPALRHAHAIDFDNKKAFFRSLIRKRSSESRTASIRITVRRDRVFADSYIELRNNTAEQLRGRLNIQFTNEEGIDAGGVTREWYVILARQIFDPNYALFCRSAAKAATYQPNKSSFVNAEHLDYFKFVGLIFGKAIYDGQLLDAYFTRAFYKHILGIKPTYHDIEAEDPEYYTSLCWMLNNDITGVIDETFCSEYEEFGQRRIVDLKPGGRDISVTEENKEEYVKLVTEVKMTKAIEQQIAAFKEGFHQLIPLKDVRIFNEVELELLTSGLPDIDVQDLKANVEYSGYTPGSPQILWFWTAVGTMGQEDLARLVMFVTGTSKVPLEGFGSLQGMNGVQKFQIHRAALTGDKTRLPSAHTCFNQLDLPEYDDAATLSECLLVAIRECSVGFGFG